MEKKIYGLSMQEVEEKRKKGEGEQEPESITKSKKQIIRENVLTLFNLLISSLQDCYSQWERIPT